MPTLFTTQVSLGADYRFTKINHTTGKRTKFPKVRNHITKAGLAGLCGFDAPIQVKKDKKWLSYPHVRPIDFFASETLTGNHPEFSEPMHITALDNDTDGKRYVKFRKVSDKYKVIRDPNRKYMVGLRARYELPAGAPYTFREVISGTSHVETDHRITGYNSVTRNESKETFHLMPFSILQLSKTYNGSSIGPMTLRENESLLMDYTLWFYLSSVASNHPITTDNLVSCNRDVTMTDQFWDIVENNHAEDPFYCFDKVNIPPKIYCLDEQLNKVLVPTTYGTDITDIQQTVRRPESDSTFLSDGVLAGKLIIPRHQINTPIKEIVINHGYYNVSMVFRQPLPKTENDRIIIEYGVMSKRLQDLG